MAPDVVRAVANVVYQIFTTRRFDVSFGLPKTVPDFCNITQRIQVVHVTTVCNIWALAHGIEKIFAIYTVLIANRYGRKFNLEFG